jgi:chemotaxis protein methyltransferase CheR
MLRDEEHSFIRQLLERHTGVAIDEQQRHIVWSRLSSLAQSRNFSGTGELLEALRRSPTGLLLDCVIDALTTHETSFFRDQSTFSALSTHVIPDLLRRRERRRRLAIWSAGCSTGQEAYSVAMLLHERFPELQGWHVTIWGTDVSRNVVQRARSGQFSERELLRGVTDRVRQKYFERCGDVWRVREFLRQAVTWETFNLNAAWPPTPTFDLVLLRNVLIYFSSHSRAFILTQTASHLASDGYLLLGTSESTFGACDALYPVCRGGVTVYGKAAP